MADYIGINDVDKLISLLQRKDEFPTRTRNKIIELIDLFYNQAVVVFGIIGDGDGDGDGNNRHNNNNGVSMYQAIIAFAVSFSDTRNDNDNDNDNDNHEILMKIIFILKNTKEFPLHTRYKIDRLVKKFLTQTEDDIHNMLCDNDTKSDNYRGLDSDRDTEAEVETAVRFFPDVLARKGGQHDAYYPIQLLSFTRDEDATGICWGCNVKAVSFIPVVAWLGIEFGLFDEKFRGGLLCEDNNGNSIWNDLLASDKTEHEAVDEKYLQVLIQLRKIGLLKKEDIQMYWLLRRLCLRSYFAERRFQFLVQWDPSALTPLDGNGCSPLHYAAYRSSTIRAFQLVFEAGVRYYPKKTGIHLLFRKTNRDRSPFQFACNEYGRDGVMEVVEDSYTSSDNTPPLNIEDALLSAAIDENIHLDCVYFLLRREPDILQKLLSSSSSSSSSITTNSTETIVTKINPKKRKIKDTKKNDHDHDGT